MFDYDSLPKVEQGFNYDLLPKQEAIEQPKEKNILMKILGTTGIGEERSFLGIQETREKIKDPKNYVKPIIGAFNELKDIGEIGVGLVSFAGKRIDKMLTQPIDFFTEPTRYLPNTIKYAPGILKEIPEVGKTLAKDTLKSFGLDLDEGQFGVDMVVDRFMERPISTIFDWTIIGGLARKGIQKALDPKNVKLLNKTMTKSLAELDEFRKTTKIKVKPELENVLDNKDKLLSILHTEPKNLTNTGFLGKVGDRFAENMSKTVAIEQKRLNRIVNRYKNDFVDFSDVARIANDLSEKKIPTEVIRNMMSQKMSKSDVGKIMKIFENKHLTIPEANDLRKSLGQVIKWNDPSDVDKILSSYYEAIRKSMASDKIRPDLNRTLNRMHNRIENFEGLDKKLKTLGGGEKFSSNYTSTKQEYDALMNLLLDTPGATSARALDNLRTINAWHVYNSFIGNITENTPAWISRYGVPISTRGIARWGKSKYAQMLMETPPLAAFISAPKKVKKAIKLGVLLRKAKED